MVLFVFCTNQIAGGHKVEMFPSVSVEFHLFLKPQVPADRPVSASWFGIPLLFSC